mmetsp:Transcript_8111/g.20106  ORF Transcript_8111/g.20106 Transcript_8111/m.20106 type:complete len:111 (-) Transcript_8111:192-524(-)
MYFLVGRTQPPKFVSHLVDGCDRSPGGTQESISIDGHGNGILVDILLFVLNGHCLGEVLELCLKKSTLTFKTVSTTERYSTPGVEGSITNFLAALAPAKKHRICIHRNHE